MILGGKGPLEGALRDAIGGDMGAEFDFVGAVEYSVLPQYLSACDVLLCPINTQFRFTRHSNWLKILEGLAVGVPVIATKTEASVVDLGSLKGIVWTGEGLADFRASIENTYKNLKQIKGTARKQAEDLSEFSIEKTIPTIVDQVLQACVQVQR
jgi:glycosyltransferase involved in cell wall biosynthesis